MRLGFSLWTLNLRQIIFHMEVGWFGGKRHFFNLIFSKFHKQLPESCWRNCTIIKRNFDTQTLPLESPILQIFRSIGCCVFCLWCSRLRELESSKCLWTLSIIVTSTTWFRIERERRSASGKCNDCILQSIHLNWR